MYRWRVPNSMLANISQSNFAPTLYQDCLRKHVRTPALLCTISYTIFNIIYFVVSLHKQISLGSMIISFKVRNENSNLVNLSVLDINLLSVYGKHRSIARDIKNEHLCSQWTYSNLLDNLSDLRLETHVQHAVGFIHDEICASPEVSLAGLQQVNETTRGGDDNLRTCTQQQLTTE